MRSPSVASTYFGLGPQNHDEHAQTTRLIYLLFAIGTLAVVPLGGFAKFGLGATLAWAPAIAISIALFASSILHTRTDKWANLLASSAAILWGGGALVTGEMEPFGGSILATGLIVLLAYIWTPRRLRQFDVEEHDFSWSRLLWRLATASFVLGIFANASHIPTQPTTGFALALSSTLPALVALLWRKRMLRWQVVALGAALGLSVASLVDAGAATFTDATLTPSLPLFSAAAIMAIALRENLVHWLSPTSNPDEPGLLTVVLLHPSRILVLSFFGICVFGTLALALPSASSSGHAVTWIDAVFTAVSATCVTGLITLDTPNAFSLFGQVIVLLLIQVGGLGIMVFSAAAVLLLGGRLSLSHERVAVEVVGAKGRAGLLGAVRSILAVTFITEGLSAMLLSVAFWMRGDAPGEAIWRGVFTAISAFCNAGFALQSDSLIPYANAPVILGIIAVTIIIGGLGPSVIVAMNWRGARRKSLHARIVIWTTAILIVLPAIWIGLLEWNTTLQGMSVVDKLSNALFQSITLRTAGFNSIDLAAVHPATWTLMILVMFVGGSPGSTAGGAKTTTIAVIVLAIFAVVRGREQVEVFGRTLPKETILRATAVASLGVFASAVALIAIQLTQTLPLDVALFETVSALATVGLSTGGTGALDGVGKIIIIVCMFAGRVGPLTLFVLLATNTGKRINHRYPEEQVPIG